ncbi:MAG: hypothetical protein M1347_00075 [Chloroflexi bacterium]|nr:hypothetical protein [Chloroflexota bacterium]
MSESPQPTKTVSPQIVGIRFQKIGKPRKALLSAVARRPLADEAISRLAKI